jgi:hypothetical protein
LVVIVIIWWLNLCLSSPHLVLEEGSVPDPDKPHDHGDVLPERSREEMPIHVTGAVQDLLEKVESIY